MDALIEIAPALAIAAVAVGVFGYVAALALAAFLPAGDANAQNRLAARLRDWFAATPAQNLGLPSAAISAFAIVTILLRAFPPSPNANGSLAFKAFGLEFSGPSGPITLWLMCFLAFVFSLELLR